MEVANWSIRPPVMLQRLLNETFENRKRNAAFMFYAKGQPAFPTHRVAGFWPDAK
jgi:hypothetical protein